MVVNFKDTKGNKYIQNARNEVNVFNKKDKLIKTIKISRR